MLTKFFGYAAISSFVNGFSTLNIERRNPEGSELNRQLAKNVTGILATTSIALQRDTNLGTPFGGHIAGWLAMELAVKLLVDNGCDPHFALAISTITVPAVFGTLWYFSNQQEAAPIHRP